MSSSVNFSRISSKSRYLEADDDRYVRLYCAKKEIEYEKRRLRHELEEIQFEYKELEGTSDTDGMV